MNYKQTGYQFMKGLSRAELHRFGTNHTLLSYWESNKTFDLMLCPMIIATEYFDTPYTDCERNSSVSKCKNCQREFLEKTIQQTIDKFMGEKV